MDPPAIIKAVPTVTLLLPLLILNSIIPLLKSIGLEFCFVSFIFFYLPVLVYGVIIYLQSRWLPTLSFMLEQSACWHWLPLCSEEASIKRLECCLCFYSSSSRWHFTKGLHPRRFQFLRSKLQFFPHTISLLRSINNTQNTKPNMLTKTQLVTKPW